MIYKRFSRRQQLTMKWWKLAAFQDKDGIICDGSIRSGKTISMAVGFVYVYFQRPEFCHLRPFNRGAQAKCDCAFARLVGGNF